MGRFEILDKIQEYYSDAADIRIHRPKDGYPEATLIFDNGSWMFTSETNGEVRRLMEAYEDESNIERV